MDEYPIFDGQIVVKGDRLAARSKTFDLTAWKDHRYETFRLGRPLKGWRFHTDGKNIGARPASNEKGGWFTFGDVILTKGDIVSTYALPGVFSHLSNVVAPAGCIINVGIASGRFDGTTGGGYQAEYVSGPKFEIQAAGFPFFPDRVVWM